jgi:hypothetical protein
MWTDLPAAFFPAAGYLVWLGAQLTAAGSLCIWLTRRDLILGPPPAPQAVTAPTALTIPSPSPPANYRRADSDTGVIPSIPGATRGPVCPTCGGAWHGPVCPPPKERTEEAPEHLALHRFLDDVDDVTNVLRVIEHDEPVTAELLARVRDGLKADDECPLTTGEIEIPTLGETPVHAGIASREPTRDLGAAVEKVRQA